jgi:hypothetical protein
MANVRSLKKDINFLTSELVTQAYMNQVFFKTTHDELVNQITEALNFRNDLIAKVNHPDGKDNPKLIKSYYSKVRKEMVEKFGKLFDVANKESVKEA